jgi:hypothetical protein
LPLTTTVLPLSGAPVTDPVGVSNAEVVELPGPAAVGLSVLFGEAVKAPEGLSVGLARPVGVPDLECVCVGGAATVTVSLGAGDGEHEDKRRKRHEPTMTVTQFRRMIAPD